MRSDECEWGSEVLLRIYKLGAAAEATVLNEFWGLLQAKRITAPLLHLAAHATT